MLENANIEKNQTSHFGVQTVRFRNHQPSLIGTYHSPNTEGMGK